MESTANLVHEMGGTLLQRQARLMVHRSHGLMERLTIFRVAKRYGEAPKSVG